MLAGAANRRREPVDALGCMISIGRGVNFMVSGHVHIIDVHLCMRLSRSIAWQDWIATA